MNLAIYLPYLYDSTNPSVRLRRLNLRKPLRALGVEADHILRYEDLEPFEHIMLSSYGEDVYNQCLELRKRGKTLYYDHSEAMWGFPYQTEVFNLCDYIVCCSSRLVDFTQEKLTSPFTKCVTITDMVEEPHPVHTPFNREKLTCVYVGMGGNSYLAKDLKPLVESLGMELCIITEHQDADIIWNRDTYLYDMAGCDIAICPQNVELQPAKSAVKVSTAMGIGLPLICSPNPAYLEIVEDGVNGFIASTKEEWAEALESLKSFKLRNKISSQALETSRQFTPRAIANKWKELLSRKKDINIALINNTLHQKYLSYGDGILDDLRLNGHCVKEFRYEDIDVLPSGFDLYLFVECRYEPEDIKDVHPRVLVTREDVDLNILPHFDVIACLDHTLEKKWLDRGFVNAKYFDKISPIKLLKYLEKDLTERRKQHNFEIHSSNIDSFTALQLPEDRWNMPRDAEHIKFTMGESKKGDAILDIGSADGWLAIYLAKNERKVSALEFVERGLDWTNKQTKRHNVEIDLRVGFVEAVPQVFSDKEFDCILAYEILEHLDYLRLPWYLTKMESLLKIGGKILISLPKQDLKENQEHLWTPSQALIDKLFSCKTGYQCNWVDIPEHGVPGNWFIKYIKE